MKTILITGGAGYIGAHTVVSLVEQGYFPVVADDLRNSSPLLLQGIKTLTKGQFTHHAIDICDKSSFFDVFEKHSFAAVIHFAAYKSVGESCTNPLSYYQNNLIGLLNVLEACERFSVKNFVFSSSCTVYGEPEFKQVFETTPKRLPKSPYGYTKWMGEQIIEDLHRNPLPFKSVCLRYFNPIGAHPSGLIGELPVGVPNNLLPYITQTAAGIREQLTIFGNDYPTPDGTCIRDYIHVCDVADAHVKALDYPETADLTFFNIGTGKGHSVLEMVEMFMRVTGKALPYSYGPRRLGDVTEIYANADEAKRTLGWSAQHTVAQAIRDAWHWEQQYNKSHD